MFLITSVAGFMRLTVEDAALYKLIKSVLAASGEAGLSAPREILSNNLLAGI